MVTRRLTPAGASRQEWAARLFVVLLLAAVSLGIAAAVRSQADIITLHASMPEDGGWQPGHLSARVGEPLQLRLTADDVVHGFAVGRHDSPEVEVRPGQVSELTLLFDEPGAYTYTCTRWCGPDHWRMRGTIEVSGGERDAEPAGAPLYVELGLDIDAPHPAAVVPAERPSAAGGERLNVTLPQELLTRTTYMEMSPAGVWLALRSYPALQALGDAELWDAVAALWRRNTTPEALALGETLYRQNCAACHGENGAGDGVFAQAAGGAMDDMRGHAVEAPTNFTNPELLGASNALLQGKILRGGMGTGMPAWGAILTDEELQALLDYLWTFQFAVPSP